MYYVKYTRILVFNDPHSSFFKQVFQLKEGIVDSVLLQETRVSKNTYFCIFYAVMEQVFAYQVRYLQEAIIRKINKFPRYFFIIKVDKNGQLIVHLSNQPVFENVTVNSRKNYQLLTYLLKKVTSDATRISCITSMYRVYLSVSPTQKNPTFLVIIKHINPFYSLSISIPPENIRKRPVSRGYRSGTSENGLI